MSKIFVIGLPRTGTTSVCVALLEAGLKVAHTAFTKASFAAAEVIADAPVFSDYQELDKLFPGSKFVYLERTMADWVNSMQMLLGRMGPHLDPVFGRFHPIMKRSFQLCFGAAPEWQEETNLRSAYERHRAGVLAYFSGMEGAKRRDDLLMLDISSPGALAQLHEFLDLPPVAVNAPFPHLNKGRNVAGFDEFKHPNKISANLSGPERRAYFDYRIDTSSV